MILRRATQGSEFTPELFSILANDTENSTSSNLRNQKDVRRLEINQLWKAILNGHQRCPVTVHKSYAMEKKMKSTANTMFYND